MIINFLEFYNKNSYSVEILLKLGDKNSLKILWIPKLAHQNMLLIEWTTDKFLENVDRTNAKTKCQGLYD